MATSLLISLPLAFIVLGQCPGGICEEGQQRDADMELLRRLHMLDLEPEIKRARLAEVSAQKSKQNRHERTNSKSKKKGGKQKRTAKNGIARKCGASIRVDMYRGSLVAEISENEQVPSADACCRLCDGTPGCTHWDYIIEYQLCSIKNNYQSDPNKVRKLPGSVSGRRSKKIPERKESAPGVDGDGHAPGPSMDQLPTGVRENLQKLSQLRKGGQVDNSQNQKKIPKKKRPSRDDGGARYAHTQPAPQLPRELWEKLRKFAKLTQKENKKIPEHKNHISKQPTKSKESEKEEAMRLLQKLKAIVQPKEKASPATPECGWATALHTDRGTFQGEHNLGRVGDKEECCRFCKMDPKCSHFVFDTARSICYLKGAPKSDVDRVAPAPGFYSGRVDPQTSAKVKEPKKNNFPDPLRTLDTLLATASKGKCRKHGDCARDEYCCCAGDQPEEYECKPSKLCDERDDAIEEESSCPIRF